MKLNSAKDPTIKTHKDIQGWFDFEPFYERMARNQLRDDDVAIEVGVWRGKSTAFLAQCLAKQGKWVTIIAVDLFNECPQDDESMQKIADRVDLYGEFLENMEQCGVSRMVETIQGDSTETASKFSDRYADFILIDALHTYAAVKSDTQAWWPKLKLGGWMAWHDADRPEVAKAIREVVGDFNFEAPRLGFKQKQTKEQS